MPGAGKTWWGTRLAEAFNLPFVDLDDFMVKREHRSIPDMFAQGENWFRAKEHAALMALIGTIKTPTIIATGGGTPCFFNNLRQMHRSGITIYLRAETDTLVARLEKTDKERPLLRGAHNMKAVLQSLYKLREPYYKQANYILHSEDISLTNFDEIIFECTNKLSPQGLSLQW